MRAPVWIVLPILAAGCAGGSGHHAARKESEQAKREPPRAAPVQQRPVQQRPAAAPHARRRAHRVVKPSKRQRAHRPRQRQRALPWRPDGTSEVVHVRVRQVAVYKSPRAKHAMLVLRRRDQNGTPRAFLVRAMRGDWVHVYLPTRPNGSLGWVRRRALKMYTNHYRLIVRLRAHRLQLWRKRHLLTSYPVAVGTRSTPTPRGLFYVVELLQPSNPGGSYGPYSFGLSAHSNVLQTFAGGDGRVGLHGTNEPGLIGSSVSHGCIRLRNAPIKRLARILPLGTPVYIRA